MASLPRALSPLPSKRQSLSREVIAEHQRDRIADASIEVFAKRGYLGTTVEQIVAAAKIGVGGFYDLFGGKEDCFLHAYDRIVAEAREQIVAAIVPGEDWADQTGCALRALLAFIADQPFRARVALVEIQTGGPAALARYEATLDSVAPLLSIGRRLSPIEDELPSALEVAVIGGLAWFLQQRVVMGELAQVEQMLPELLGLVIGPYLGEAAAAEYIAAAGP